MKRRKKDRPVKYVATYIGPQKDIKLAPRIGKITRGVPFEVPEKIANTLKFDRNFTVKKKFE